MTECIISSKKNSDLFRLVRDFFVENGFVDILVPPMVSHPGIEPHTHPFKVSPTFSNTQSQNQKLFLHSSPEFFMKELLSQGMEKILLFLTL